MSDLSLLRSPEFRGGIEEFADAATTMAQSLNSFLLLLNADVETAKLLPHLQTAMAAAQRVHDSGQILNGLMRA